jgi:tRNA (guanine37-N1)-methyltransferase
VSAPSYTRPPEYRGHRVPDVLLAGDHAAVAAWRDREGERLTAARAADERTADALDERARAERAAAIDEAAARAREARRQAAREAQARALARKAARRGQSPPEEG